MGGDELALTKDGTDVENSSSRFELVVDGTALGNCIIGNTAFSLG